MRINKLVFIFILIATSVSAQKKELKNYFHLKGYMKDLSIVNHSPLTGIVQDNFLHQRLNLRIYPTQNITAGIELRTRFFYGETVKLNPNYAETIDMSTGLVDASWLLIDQPGYFLHSTIDRGWVNYSNNRWDITLGRQRINWGISTIWNPNDLFNTFNFADFDYEERPGADALRIQHYFKNRNSAEIAIKPDSGMDNSVYAGLYKFNKWNTDFQILGGVYYTDWVIGGGFAGNLGMAGIKSEMSYFIDRKNINAQGVFSGTIGMDYSFRNGLYVGGSALLNSSGVSSAVGLTNPTLFSNTLSAKNLMPTQWSALTQVSYAFNPIISASAATIYTPGVNLWFAMPSITLTIANNWDILLLSQAVVSSNLPNFTSFFLRTKFSF